MSLFSIAACGDGAIGAGQKNDLSDTGSGLSWDRNFTLNDLNWISLDEEEFKMRSVGPPFATGPLPESGQDTYEVVERLQTWLDLAFDTIALDWQQENPATPFAVPRPKVRVVPALEPNGWVAGVGTCYRTSVDLGDLNPNGQQRREQVVLFANKVFDRMPGRQWGAPPETCVEREASLDDLAAYFNGLGGDCRLEVVGDGMKVVGNNCQYGGNAAQADELIVLSTANYINITSEMIAVAPSEAAVVATLLHELAHYLKAHPQTTEIASRYNQWYAQPDLSDHGKVATADSASLSQRLANHYAIPRIIVPNQLFTPDLSKFIVLDLVGNILRDGCADGSCACGDAVAVFNRDWARDFRCVGCGFVSKDAEEKYLALEEALLECAQRVTVSATPSSGEISLETLNTALQGYPRLITSQDTSDQTLEAWLLNLDSQNQVTEAKRLELIHDISSRQLGKYTAEEEADDFTVPLWRMLGLDLNDRVNAAHELTRVRFRLEPHRFERENGFSFEWYQSLFEAGWEDEAGQYTYIPLGNIHDLHHGMPFRTFNISRLAALSTQPDLATPPTFSSSWEKIVQLAEDLRATVTSRPGPSFALDGAPQTERSESDVIPNIIDGL